MTDKEFKQFTNEVFDRCNGIMNAKGPDYSGTEDRLANFTDVAKKVGISPMQVWAVYYLKHEAALEKFVRGEVLTGEPIESKMDDLINYLVLGQGIQKQNEVHTISKDNGEVQPL